MNKILCMDSEADYTTQIVADWRIKNVYPSLQNNGHAFESLNGSMAIRAYLQEDLNSPEVVLFTGSGHGLPDEFQGTDGDAALKVNSYQSSEVQNKIIHLLSCNTAQNLGSDVVKNGCLAFFGYDLPFTFDTSLMDLFLNPDAVLVESLSQGQNANDAYLALKLEYEKSLAELRRRKDFASMSIMLTNFEHFRSPIQDKRWGSKTASI